MARPDLRVAIDLRILDAPEMERTGVGRYALEVTRGIAAVRPEWLLTIHSNPCGVAPASAGMEIVSTRWPTSGSIGRVAWLHTAAARRHLRPAVWFSPAFVLPLWWRGPAVVTVHDLPFLQDPQRYRGRLNATYARLATKYSARRAQRVLCGSEATRRSLDEEFGVDAGSGRCRALRGRCHVPGTGAGGCRRLPALGGRVRAPEGTRHPVRGLHLPCREATSAAPSRRRPCRLG